MNSQSEPQPLPEPDGGLVGVLLQPPALAYAFDIRVDFDRRVISGPVSGGGKMGFVGISGGTLRGPRLCGRVLPFSGGDYAHVRPDGVVEINAHYMLEASDGTLIYLQNRGFLDRAHQGASVPAGGSTAGATPYYFRVTPVFRAPNGPHDWLTRTVILGVGERHQDPDYTSFRYYAVL
jgi:hypothetical protein